MSTSKDLEQINAALDLLRRANGLLAGVVDGWSVPDAPERPPVINALGLVKNEALKAASTSDRLLATMR